MSTEISSASFFDRRVRDTLETLCCPSLQFMWDNSVLVPREDLDIDSEEHPPRWYSRTLKGFRVVRDFGFMKRDQILYRCPFCDAELIAPLGYMHDQQWLHTYLFRIGQGKPKLGFSLAQLKRWLTETKDRCRGGWPPVD